MQRYCFESDKFQVVNGEDEETNPGIYGLELSKWLEKELNIRGYSVQEIIPEDWGWCVICKHRPFLLWVGCQGEVYDDKLIWSCFVEAEKPIFRNPFKKLDISESLNDLDGKLFELISHNFSLIDCP